MHKIAIPQSVVDRVIARRGREHIHDDLDPAKTALVVVDMQNALHAAGRRAFALPEAQEIVPNINRLAQAVRETGGAVVWIQTAYTDETHEELVGLLRHLPSPSRTRSAPKRSRPAARATNCGRRSTRGRTTLSSRRSASPPSSRARRTSPRCCARGHRHHSGHRHRHQRVLRIDRARRHDVQLQDRHGDRRQRRRHRRGPQRVARQRST